MISQAMQSAIEELGKLRIEKPRTEKALEGAVAAVLKRVCESERFTLRWQRALAGGRPDLAIVTRNGTVVFEMKMIARASCFEQLDRYSAVSSGLVIVCWRATNSFKSVFRQTTTSIPLALVELKKNAPMIG